jgi:hypothetical protein
MANDAGLGIEDYVAGGINIGHVQRGGMMMMARRTEQS